MPVISATVSAWGLRSHTQQSIATVLGGKGSPCRSPFAPLCGMERRAPILHRRFCGTIRRPGLDFGVRGVLINTRCICSDRSWSPTAVGAPADQGHDRARQHNTQSIRVALMARISSEERTLRGFKVDRTLSVMGRAGSSLAVDILLVLGGADRPPQNSICCPTRPMSSELSGLIDSVCLDALYRAANESRDGMRHVLQTIRA